MTCCKKRKVTYILGIIMGIAGFLLIILYSQREQMLNAVASYSIFDEEQKYLEQFTFEVDKYAAERFSDDLRAYLCAAIQAENIEEKLIAIEAEYQSLNTVEKMLVMLKSNDGIIASFHNEQGKLEDEWYKVTLHKHEDIVIKQVDENGKVINYYFENLGGTGKTYEMALRSGGQADGELFFIKWDNKNYLVTLSKNDKQFVEMIIYDYADYSVMCIGLDNLKNLTVSYQICNAGSYRGTYWPKVF